MTSGLGRGLMKKVCVAASETQCRQGGPSGGRAQDGARPCVRRWQQQRAERHGGIIEERITHDAAKTRRQWPAFRHRPGGKEGGRQWNESEARHPAAHARHADQHGAHGAADHHGKTRCPGRPAKHLTGQVREDGTRATEQILDFCICGGVPARIAWHVGPYATTYENAYSECRCPCENPPDRVADARDIVFGINIVCHEVGLLHLCRGSPHFDPIRLTPGKCR